MDFTDTQKQTAIELAERTYKTLVEAPGDLVSDPVLLRPGDIVVAKGHGKFRTAVVVSVGRKNAKAVFTTPGALTERERLLDSLAERYARRAAVGTEYARTAIKNYDYHVAKVDGSWDGYTRFASQYPPERIEAEKAESQAWLDERPDRQAFIEAERERGIVTVTEAYEEGQAAREGRDPFRYVNFTSCTIKPNESKLVRQSPSDGERYATADETELHQNTDLEIPGARWVRDEPTGEFVSLVVPASYRLPRDIEAELAESAETFERTGVLTEVPTDEALEARGGAAQAQSDDDDEALAPLLAERDAAEAEAAQAFHEETELAEVAWAVILTGLEPAISGADAFEDAVSTYKDVTGFEGSNQEVYADARETARNAKLPADAVAAVSRAAIFKATEEAKRTEARELVAKAVDAVAEARLALQEAQRDQSDAYSRQQDIIAESAWATAVLDIAKAGPDA